MKSDFQFANLCGTVYRQGNVVFSPDGNAVYSPVGNRVSCFDLVHAQSFTFPFENRKTIATLALSPSGTLLLAIDEDGHATLANTNRRVVLASHHFKDKVRSAAFSPDGKWIVVATGKNAQVWKTPGFHREFAPFILHRVFTGHFDDVVHVAWRADSRVFLTCARDMTTRVFAVTAPSSGYQVITLGGHRHPVIGAYFAGADQSTIYSISRDGTVLTWKLHLDPDTTLPTRAEAAGKHYFAVPGAKAVTTAWHATRGLLVVGFSTGVFGLWELPSFSHVHTLSLGQHPVTAAAINASGEWLALGSAALGQLVVWEWPSESYVLKQQGHAYDLTSVAWSPAGVIATGGDDAKIKLWNDNGFAYVTFDQHAGPVSGLQFARHGRVLFSSSLDGTVRAFDLTRYRNFKTYTTPEPMQFACLAVDEGCDLVCAGAVDKFDVHVWAVQTGKLLETLAGHTAPVSCMAFAGTQLVTGSWDRTVRVWNVFERTLAMEAFQHQSEVLALAVRGDAQHVAVATLDGLISVWHLRDSKQVAVIDGRRDIKGGRKVTDLVNAHNAGAGKCFTSLCYTADGEYLLAGGRSKYVCIYHVASATLVRRFQVSHNMALDGIVEELNSRRMTEAGTNLDVLERLTRHDTDRDAREAGTLASASQLLPGAQRGDLAERTTHPEIRTSGVRFSPTGRAWCAASPEGLLIYALDDRVLFDPFDLDVDITPTAIADAVQAREYATALLMALRLSEPALVLVALEAVPPARIELIVKDLPRKYVPPLVQFVAKYAQKSKHVEFVLMWVAAVVRYHARELRGENGVVGAGDVAAALRLLKKAVAQWSADLGKVADENAWTMQFLLAAKRDLDFDGTTAGMEVDADA
ncbi:hypothetical protein GGF32_005278 [Allomyces javanicus]|nr:hypothetical protein GGF32_005278 [Allomyces javanicus]